MGFLSHVGLMLAIGVLLGLSAHLYWQGIRQLMPATGGLALLAAYVFILATNAGVPLGISCAVAVLTGGLVGLLLPLAGHGVSRAEFMLLGLALVEIIRRAAYNFPSLTGGTNGLSLEGVSWATPVVAASIAMAFALLAILITFGAWRNSFGMTLRLVGASPRGATMLGISTNKYELVCATLGGSLAATAGIFYALTIQYIHPDDFGMTLGLPALAAGLAIRPRFVLFDVPVISLVLFGLREILRFAGTGTARFSLHDLLIGLILVAVAIQMGRHTPTENESRWERP